MVKQIQNPWVHSARLDSLFILLPPFLAVCLLYLFRPYLDLTTGTPNWAWIPLFMFSEYAHLYSTIYRTYLDPTEFNKNRIVFLTVPVVCFLFCFYLTHFGELWYWRVITYMATYHFVRQQYGFMRMYSRNEQLSQMASTLDALVIYVGALYPLIFEHLHLPRNYNWGMAGETDVFIPLYLGEYEWIPRAAYWAIVILYFGKEFLSFYRTNTFNLPKNLMIFGTLLSWYVGLIIFNGDFSFYIFTQLTHSIPYMALVWMYGDKKWNHKDISKAKAENKPLVAQLFKPQMFFLFVGFLALFAYLDAGLWNKVFGHEFPDIFPEFFSLLSPNSDLGKRLLIALLTLPQINHYWLDAFIWRMRKGPSQWRLRLWSTKSENQLNWSTGDISVSKIGV